MEHNNKPMWWKSVWVQRIGIIALGFLGVQALVFFDVVSRAKHAYQEGEKYLFWHQNPSAKIQYFDDWFDSQKSNLDKKKANGDYSADEYDDHLRRLEFDKQFLIEESSLKYSYQWFKDTYELFSPPESSWVKKARLKAPAVQEMWKAELREKKIPFEETMVE